ncbi:MAG: hypothetical protein QGG36_19335 [Pirellulaceae bacterium]|jgi:hypothetical protein|nr:hypothetical protein [Pirellulaceae bacterium]MDP7017968.1 hypothetical protein [Pirellulaceae bacterium]
MEQPSIEITCPTCGVEQSVSLPVGATAACVNCYNAYIVPSADDDLDESGEAESPEEEASDGWVSTAVVGGLLLVLLIATAGVVLLVVSGGGWEWRPGAESGTSESAGETEPESSAWTDAKRFSIRQQGVKVRVTRVQIDYVRGKDADAKVITSDDPNYLIIGLQVTNQVEQPRQYRSWYGNQFNGLAATIFAADRGAPFAMTTFSDVERVQGHTPEAELSGGDDCRDVLIFSLPQGAVNNQLGPLHLELPGAALGIDGVYRFEIPAAMINDLSAEPLPETGDPSIKPPANDGSTPAKST